jgi:membrane dipeptidase
LHGRCKYEFLFLHFPQKSCHIIERFIGGFMGKNITYLFGLQLIFVFCLVGCSGGQETKLNLAEKAQQMARQFIIVDTHIDVPYRLREKMEDISTQTKGGHFDYVRAKAGGLDAPFMSIYIPSSYQETGGAKLLADSLIDMVEGFAKQWPDKFAMAFSPEDIKQNFQNGRMSLLMGMENGAPVEDDLENVKYFYDRGIRYITLTHAKNNHICDSSYDTIPKWNGLSTFGEKVVAEMNRQGIMIDVSHITDSAFYDVLKITKAPIIASHSSCRYFTLDWERNMDDEMIKALGKNGGVIQINFGSSFLKSEYREEGREIRKELNRHLDEKGWDRKDEHAKAYLENYYHTHHLGIVADVADHIDHVVQLVGIDHVGLGSDFDGVSFLPQGLEDVSMYPNLIHELLERGYSEEDIEKICSGNVLRVMSEVAERARQLQSI